MKDIRRSDDISGLWAAAPMTWSSTGKLDEAMFGRNLERLAAVPCDGIYSTDSDGEFYALELQEFEDFVAAFARLMSELPCGIQVGVTWTNTQGIIDRIRICLERGISTVHICYPYWMPLNRADVGRFWSDLAEAVPQSRWVHYNTPRGHVKMSGADYRRLSIEYPEQLIGTKLGTQNYVEIAEAIYSSPHLAHVLTDFTVVPGMMLGARGTYSFWVNTLPQWQRRLVDLCLAREWEAAAKMQSKFNAWETACVEPLVKKGYLHGIVGKARAAASGFLEDGGHTRPPYLPVPIEDVQALADEFGKWWSAELKEESFPQRSTLSP
jgi:dihydrodipicolinate synthase/N-acetylneuraminate lyase